MESSNGSNPLQEQLQEIERGESAAWVVYPPTPAWWAVGFGLWAATLTVVIGLLDGIAGSLALLGLVAVMFGVMAWDRRRRGTYPNRRPPRELRPAIARLVIGATVVGVVAWVAGAQGSIASATAIAAIGAWAVVVWYERQYALIAARIRERLS